MKIFGTEINEKTCMSTLDTAKGMLKLNISASEEYIDRYKEDVKAWHGILTITKDPDTYTSIREFIDKKQKYIDKYIDELHEFMKQMKFVCELIDVKNIDIEKIVNKMEETVLYTINEITDVDSKNIENNIIMGNQLLSEILIELRDINEYVNYMKWKVLNDIKIHQELPPEEFKFKFLSDYVKKKTNIQV